jgi:hypothetical protein
VGRRLLHPGNLGQQQNGNWSCCNNCTSEGGYLGMNQHTLSVGDTQTFIFQAGDNGPFWMTEEERELNHHDQTLLPPTPGNWLTRNKTIQELKIELAALNVVLSERRQYCLAELQEIARNNNIDPKIEKNKSEERLGGPSKRSFASSL